MPSSLQLLRDVVGPANFVAEPATDNPMLIDERDLYRGRAAAIVLPQTTQELARAVKICADADIAMVPQGGNTGYCGGATPDESGQQVLFNMSRMNQIRNVDATGLTLTAQAGVVLAVAQEAAARRNLLLPLSMASQGSCQLGGNISTNAGGLAVLRYGTAKELVAGLEVVLPDGQVWSDLKGLRKDNTGYDLKQLFMGAEGTLGIISAVVLRLQPRPKALLTAWLEIGELTDAVATLTLLRSQLGDCITSFEYISGQALALVLEHIPGTRNPLTDTSGHYALVELAAFDDGGSLSRDLQSALETAIVNTGVRDVVIAQNETQRRDLWRLRESIPAAEKRAGGSVKHDVSVEIDALGEFVDLTLIALAAEFPASQASVYGHVGDGNVHLNVLAPASVSPQYFKRECAVEVSALIHSIAIARGGSFSAEHGVGRLKRTLLAETADPIALDLMRKIKQALDPKGLMNPGKVI